MLSMNLSSAGTASAMDMLHSVRLHQGPRPMLRAWYMGPVFASTILVGSTVSSVRISIRTFPGILLRMAILTPVGSVSATGIVIAATLTWLCTWHLET